MSAQTVELHAFEHNRTKVGLIEARLVECGSSEVGFRGVDFHHAHSVEHRTCEVGASEIALHETSAPATPPQRSLRPDKSHSVNEVTVKSQSTNVAPCKSLYTKLAWRSFSPSKRPTQLAFDKRAFGEVGAAQLFAGEMTHLKHCTG